jgi:sulfur carrier protein
LLLRAPSDSLVATAHRERVPPIVSRPSEPDSQQPQNGSAALPVSVNGAPREVPAGTSVRGLLGMLGLGGRRVAVAVNRSVVPRSAYDSQRLAAGDRVEVLEAVGGG